MKKTDFKVLTSRDKPEAELDEAILVSFPQNTPVHSKMSFDLFEQPAKSGSTIKKRILKSSRKGIRY
jgi:hypothetical protein